MIYTELSLVLIIFKSLTDLKIKMKKLHSSCYILSFMCLAQVVFLLILTQNNIKYS